MKQLIRRLHAGPRVPDFAGEHVVRATPKVDPRMPQLAKFTVLGSGSLLQVSLPPSTPLHASRNSLTGVLGTSKILATLGVANSPLARLWAGQSLVQQRILTTEPATCLIGTNSSRRHITALELDGSVDWCVTRPALVHAVCGRSIHVVPRYGWRPGYAPFAHTTINGRGLVALACPGPLVQLAIPEGESALIQRHHLAAYSTDINSAQQPPRRISVEYDVSPAPELKPEPKQDLVEAEIPVATAPQGYRAKAIEALKKTYSATRTAWSWARKHLQRGNSSYIEVYGPSTVLISASAPPLAGNKK